MSDYPGAHGRPARLQPSSLPPPVAASPPSGEPAAEDASLPQDFICPITQAPMVDPHVCADGHSYEHDAISAWLERHDTSPQTNLPLAHKQLVPNITLRNAIIAFQSRAEVPAPVAAEPAPAPESRSRSRSQSRSRGRRPGRGRERTAAVGTLRTVAVPRGERRAGRRAGHSRRRPGIRQARRRTPMPWVAVAASVPTSRRGPSGGRQWGPTSSLRQYLRRVSPRPGRRAFALRRSQDRR